MMLEYASYILTYHTCPDRTKIMICNLFSHTSILPPHWHISVQGRLHDEHLHSEEHLVFEQEHLISWTNESGTHGISRWISITLSFSITHPWSTLFGTIGWGLHSWFQFISSLLTFLQVYMNPILVEKFLSLSVSLRAYVTAILVGYRCWYSDSKFNMQIFLGLPWLHLK